MAAHHDLQPRSGKNGVLRLIRLVVEHTDPRTGLNAPAHSGGLNAALSRLRRVSRPGSLVVLLGDYYGIDDDSGDHLLRLRQHSDVVGHPDRRSAGGGGAGWPRATASRPAARRASSIRARRARNAPTRTISAVIIERSQPPCAAARFPCCVFPPRTTSPPRCKNISRQASCARAASGSPHEPDPAAGAAIARHPSAGRARILAAGAGLVAARRDAACAAGLADAVSPCADIASAASAGACFPRSRSLEQQLASERTPDALAHMSVLLRRLALMRFPRQHVAALTGNAWLRFLDESGGNGRFTARAGPVAGHRSLSALPALRSGRRTPGRVVARMGRKKRGSLR